MNHPDPSEESFSFPYKNKWVRFLKSEVTDKELKLIQLLLKQTQHPHQSFKEASEWKKFLLNETKELPAAESMYRVIQFYFDFTDEAFSPDLWTEGIYNLFHDIEDVFFVHDREAVAIQKLQTPQPFEEIGGMLQTLDDDFSTRTFAFIGGFFPLNEQFPLFYQEEHHVFLSERNQINEKVFRLSDVALSYYTKNPKSESQLMTYLKKVISKNGEWKELILTLWKTQGNISLAAKQLYIHRNTLQYRLDRYYEETGLSLRDINDLALSYLAVV